MLDMDTIGSVRKNIVVVRENDEESPWARSTPAPGSAPTTTPSRSSSPSASPTSDSRATSTATSWPASISAFDTVHGGYFSNLFGGSGAKHSPNGRLLLVAPPHAEALQRDGIDRERLQELLFEYGHQPVAR
ncbi:hypothetical protein [Pseudonocardia autotrophica]|uniref:hypothetical protein n=1 Tax=Pseudonocardia autotrophica TaxID=2074 RepID=UPI00105F70D8|nr:hypothetical protein [Pseudonocardia autotrophica]